MKSKSPDRATISPADEAALTAFFGEYSTAIESSSFGLQIERLCAVSSGHKKCSTCRGGGWVKRAVSVCGHCADGWTAPAKDPAAIRAKCQHCNGTRVVEAEGRSSRSSYSVQEICPTCTGWGAVARRGQKYVPPSEVTVRPTGSSKQGGATGAEPDVPSLTGYHSVARRLVRLPEAAQLALGLYYGIGVDWRRFSAFGQIWPVLTLTVQGKKLIERHSSAPPNDLPGRMLPSSAWTYDDAGETWCLRPHEPKSDYAGRDLPDWDELTQPELLSLLHGGTTPSAVWGAARAEAVALLADAQEQYRVTGLGLPQKRPKPKQSQLQRLSVVHSRIQAVRTMSPVRAVVDVVYGR